MKFINKKSILMISLMAITAILVVVGTSYALFNMNITKNSKFKTVVGKFKMEMSDTVNGNQIVINNLIPTKDSEGLATDGYTFTITNTGSIDANYSIYLEDFVPTGETKEKIDNKFIRVNLSEAGHEDAVNTKTLGSLSKGILIADTLKAKKSVTYTLKIWLDYNSDNTVQGKYFAAKIKINSFQEKSGIRELAISTLKPGLYDDKYNLLAGWDLLVNDYGLNVEKDYEGGDLESYYESPSNDGYVVEKYKNKNVTSLCAIVSNNDELKNGTVLVLGNVSRIGNGALVSPNLEEVFIPNTVVEIGSGAFAYDRSLNTIEFQVNSNLTTIGTYAFRDCTSLTSIHIPESVTSIGDGAFQYCTGLTSVNIPDGITTIGFNTFSDCESLITITIPESVTSIDRYAFDYCENLTSIHIPASVTEIGECAFRGTGALESLTVDPNNPIYDSRNNSNAIIETATNTLIQGSTNTIIPNSVTTIGAHSFESCKTLTSIDIPSSVTKIGKEAFTACTALTTVNLSNGVTTIEEDAFRASGLTSIYIPSSVETIDSYAFRYTRNLESIIVDPNNTVYDSRNNSNAIIKRSTATIIAGCKNTVIPNTVTSIEDWAFYASGITSITIPSNVTRIGKYAFEYSLLDSATFIDPNGWKAGDTSLSSTDLSDTSKAAEYLRKDYTGYNYCNYTWTKTNN